MATMRVDPHRSFNFKVEVKGVIEGEFQECSGLDSQTASIDYREGGDARHLRKIPGLNAFTPITLKRGMTNSDQLWNWHRSATKGAVDRRSGAIILTDQTGAEVKRWSFFEAWPSKWTGPAFNATSNTIAIETLELTYEDLKGPGDPV